MSKTNTFKQLCMLLLCLLSFNMTWASTYYARAAAHAVGATGAGLVYASKENSRPADSAFGTDVTSDYNSNTGQNSDTWEFYVWALPQGDGIFKGWYDKQNCTGSALSTSESYTTAKYAGEKDNKNYAKDFYALFVYHYFAKVNATAVGEGGVVSVNSGASGVTASATLESGDMTTQPTTDLDFTITATPTDNQHFFVGWYSDANCENLVSNESGLSFSISTSATNVGAAVTENYYAKFEEINDSDYNFTLIANPDHFITIEGGAEGALETLNYSTIGADNESDASPFFTLSVNPVANVVYCVKVYDSSDALIATYNEYSIAESTCAIPNNNLDGARIVVESREGWIVTVKGNPDNLSSVVYAGQTLNPSADGTVNIINYTTSDNFTITPSNDMVIVSLMFYNAAGELVYTAFEDQSGVQTANYDLSNINGGTVEVAALELGSQVKYFTIKADPAFIKSIKGVVKDTSTTPADSEFTIDLKFSPEGRINVYPSDMDAATNGDYFHYMIEPQNSNISYSVDKIYTKGTTNTNSFTGTVCKSYLHGTTSIEINEAVINIEAYELLPAGSISYTIIADPEKLLLREFQKATGANYVNPDCSLEGETYTPATQFTQIQMQAKNDAAIKSYNAYFYLAGADITNPDEAYLAKTNIQVKKTDSWYYSMDKRVSNTYANGGTLVIECQDGVGTGNITINVSGTAENVVISNGYRAGTDTDEDTTNYVSVDLGDNTYTLQSATLSFTHATNGNYLKSVTLTRNGVTTTIKANPPDTSGKITYSVKDAREGDIYTVVTDYSNEKFPVYVDLPEGCEDFVVEVTEADAVITKAEGKDYYEVKDGNNVRVQGDKFNYKVKSVSIDGVDQLVNSSVGCQVLGETRIAFDVEYITRNETFSLEIASSNSKILITTAQGSSMECSSDADIPFCTADFPIKLNCTDTRVSTSNIPLPQRYPSWKVEGTLRSTATEFQYEPVANQKVTFEFTSKETKVCNVRFDRGDLEAWPTIKQNGEEVTPGSLAVESGTVITVCSNDLVNVTGVKKNGVKVTPNEDGEYVITIAPENADDTGDATITISGEMIPQIPDVPAYETVTVDVNNKATYASQYDLYFWDGDEVDVKAYVAAGYSDSNMGIQFVRVTGRIPAETGLLILATDKNATSVMIDVVNPNVSLFTDGEEEEGESIFDNNLLVSALHGSVIPASDEEYDRYQFRTEGTISGFHPLPEPIAAIGNQAYLVLPKNDKRPSELIVTAGMPNVDGTTGVESVVVENESNDVYNILGVKVAESLSDKSLKPGMYIVKGKKVLIRK